jgi:hypothetical protein
MFDSNLKLQLRPPTVNEGILLYSFGFVFFQLTFHFCHRWLQHSGFLEALQRFLLSTNDVTKSKDQTRDVISKSKPYFDEASIFELSNWLVSTLQVKCNFKPLILLFC